MHLYVPTMDARLVDFTPDGRVRLDQEGWSTPTLQERRAIIHAARLEIAALEELLAALGGAENGEGV
jgi:acyl-CoA reductase-like NAD-dependent aldehyde dehydrogenase